MTTREMYMDENALFVPRKKEVSHQDQDLEAPALSFLQDAWRRLKKNKTAVVCMVILIVISILAFGCRFFAPYDPNEQYVAWANLPMKIPHVHIHGLDGYRKLAGQWVDVYAQKGVPDNIFHIFGTDEFGRDLFSRALYGTRISLIIAFLAAVLDLTIGVSYGLISGMAGGRVDNIMQRFLEILSGVPSLVIVVIMILIFEPGMTSILLAMVLTSWISMARIVRAETLRIKNMEYVSAARVLGAGKVYIAIHHVIPNLSGIIVVRTFFSIPSAIFFETFLSFIGVGMKVPNASIGTLLNSGYKVFRLYPSQMWIPAIIICVIMLAFNLFADGLRDAFDPKMKD